MIDNSIIRPAEKADLPELVHLCRLHAAYEESAYDSENKENKLKHHLFSEYPSLFCLVAEYETKVVGYITYMKQFSTWDADFYVYMDCLFLLEEIRGYGLGEKLINEVKKEARRMSCITIQWQTPDFNKRAIQFYNRIGATSKSKERFFLPVK